MRHPREGAAPRVVIVGAGMAGLAAARQLAGVPAQVLVLDEHNYMTFPPLLFQVATGFISSAEVARPVRAKLRRQPNVTFRMARVTGVDVAARKVKLDGLESVTFDYLVLACGVASAFGHVAGAARGSIPLKTVNDANRLRNSLLRSFEEAAAHPDRPHDAKTSIVVIGGGASGVELSGYVANFLFHYQFTRDYPQLDPASMRVTLLERGDRLLTGFHPRLSAYALDTLTARGVDVRLATDVLEVDTDGVTLSGGQRIPASTVVWAGGVEAPNWTKASGFPLTQGRVVVDSDLRVRGLPNVFAVGDLAAIPARAGGLSPQVAQVALQTGRHVGRQIARLLEGEPTADFSYFDKGQMAIVGRNAAIVQTGKLRVTGRLAWVMWGLLHLGYLPGTVNRTITGLKYLWWHLAHENANRVLIEPDPPETAGRDAGLDQVDGDQPARSTPCADHPTAR